MNDTVLTDESKLFKALMHPVRLAILDMLRDGEECVCHMEAALGHRQAYISQQLSVLRQAGLVQDRREGLNVYYWVTQPNVFVVLDAARVMAASSVKSSQPSTRLATCPCPKCNAVLEEEVV